MKLKREMNTGDVKEIFKTRFPMLKIEFYTIKHDSFEGSSKDSLIGTDQRLASLNPKMKDGEFSLDPELTVKEFESQMEEVFGLHVQVFRKSGDSWLQTSSTDSWTLGKQEVKGESQDRFLHSE